MFVGQPVTRKDGRAKVTGTARYSAEFALPGMVHAALVCSTIAAGTIAGLDTAAAERLPGVLAIVTPWNALRLQDSKADPQSVTSSLLQDRSVAYNGQPIAVVVADTLDRALDAASAVRVRYEPTESVTTMEANLSQAYPPKHFRDGQRPPDSRRGDPDGAFAGAPVRIEATYVTPIEHHNPMEPHATLATWDGDRLTVWTSTQAIGGAQKTLAHFFRLAPDKVQVFCPFVGGGFGCKGNTWPPATLAAMAARMVGRPVRLVLTRAQMFTCNGYRPQTIQHLRLGAERDGRLVAVRHDGLSQMSMPSQGEFTEPVGLATEMLYACPNLAVTHRLVPTNMGLPTYMRAPGEASGVFALESAMDELAAALQMDPLELRLRNYAETDPHENKPFSSKKLRECYAQGAAAFGWAQRDPRPRQRRDGDWLVGTGMATSTYPTHRQAAQARIRLGADGIAVVQSGTQDLGTGTYTVMAQVAADALGLPLSRVRAELGASLFPPAPASGGSQTVASVMPAVQAAAEALRTKILALAAADPRFGGLSASDLQLRGTMVSGGGRQVPLGALLARTGTDRMEATAAAKPGDEKNQYSMHAFGAQFAELRVHALTGEIRLSRYLGAFEAGRFMNAKTARSQIMGGIVYGIGMGLLEETAVDPEFGRVVNANISEYVVPANADVPAIEVIMVDGDDRIANPSGAKGLGELPMVGVAAALANAVWHATGVRVRRVPIRADDLLPAL